MATAHRAWGGGHCRPGANRLPIRPLFGQQRGAHHLAPVPPSAYCTTNSRRVGTPLAPIFPPRRAPLPAGPAAPHFVEYARKHCQNTPNTLWETGHPAKKAPKAPVVSIGQKPSQLRHTKKSNTRNPAHLAEKRRICKEACPFAAPPWGKSCKIAPKRAYAACRAARFLIQYRKIWLSGKGNAPTRQAPNPRPPAKTRR